MNKGLMWPEWKPYLLLIKLRPSEPFSLRPAELPSSLMCNGPRVNLSSLPWPKSLSPQTRKKIYSGEWEREKEL